MGIIRHSPPRSPDGNKVGRQREVKFLYPSGNSCKLRIPWYQKLTSTYTQSKSVIFLRCKVTNSWHARKKIFFRQNVRFSNSLYTLTYVALVVSKIVDGFIFVSFHVILWQNNSLINYLSNKSGLYLPRGRQAYLCFKLRQTSGNVNCWLLYFPRTIRHSERQTADQYNLMSKTTETAGAPDKGYDSHCKRDQEMYLCI